MVFTAHLRLNANEQMYTIGKFGVATMNMVGIIRVKEQRTMQTVQNIFVQQLNVTMSSSIF